MFRFRGTGSGARDGLTLLRVCYAKMTLLVPQAPPGTGKEGNGESPAAGHLVRKAQDLQAASRLGRGPRSGESRQSF